MSGYGGASGGSGGTHSMQSGDRLQMMQETADRFEGPDEDAISVTFGDSQPISLPPTFAPVKLETPGPVVPATPAPVVKAATPAPIRTMLPTKTPTPPPTPYPTKAQQVVNNSPGARTCPTQQSQFFWELQDSSDYVVPCYTNEDCKDYNPVEALGEPACCSYPYCVCATIYEGSEENFQCTTD